MRRMADHDNVHPLPLRECLRSPEVSSTIQELCERIDEAHLFFEDVRKKQPDAILRTALLKSSWLSSEDLNAYVKLETEQVTSSFKARGALFYTHKAVQRGVRHIVTASSGNHGLGLVNALKVINCSGTVFVPQNAAPNKIKALQRAMKSTKARLEFAGYDCGDTEAAAAKSLDQDKYESRVYVSPYNDMDIIAGQGTIATEILDSLESASKMSDGVMGKKCCYITVGGGGLVCGIAAKLNKEQPGQWRVIGCLPKHSPIMYKSVKAGRVVDEESKATLSDGSAGGLEQDTKTLPICANLVDAWVLISEEDIKFAMTKMFEEEGKLLEGSAGVALAGFLRDKPWRMQNHCDTAVVIACGANIDAHTFVDVVSGH